MICEMNLEGNENWQADRDEKIERRELIFRTLRENGGRMGIKELMAATGLKQLSVILCCTKWPSYFEIERKGWRDAVTHVQIHRHLKEINNG